MIATSTQSVMPVSLAFILRVICRCVKVPVFLLPPSGLPDNDLTATVDGPL